VRAALLAVALSATAAACGSGTTTPALSPSGPRLTPPPAIDPSARGAAYLAQISEHIQPAWAQFLEDCRLRLPKEHPLNAPGLAATAELAIARDGRVLSAELVEPSGNADFDLAARGVLGDASPLPRPPSDLESDDEAVHVRWLFARDRRQAGPATARVVTVELPLLGVVDRLLARDAIVRAAHRILQAPVADPDRPAAAERVMIAALREGLASANGGVRRAAVEAVGRAGVQALAGEIRTLLVSTVDVDLRLAAVGAAAALGDPTAAPAILADYRADLAGRPRVALEKTAALLKLGRAADVAAAIRAELEAPPPDAAQPVPPIPPGSPRPPTPPISPVLPGATALAALAIAPDPELAPKLASWFQRGDARVRAGVCAALPASAPVQAPQLLARGLRDADASVRAACADAAGRLTMSARTAAPAGGPDARTGGSVRAGDAAADAQLVRRLRELVRDPDRIVRARAIAALAVVEPGFRIRVIDDPAAEVRVAGAAVAGEADLRALAGDRDADVRAAAITYLGNQAPDLLLRAAADGAAQVRRVAVAALTDEATLEHLAHDDSPEVATAAQVRLAIRRGRAALAIPFLQRIITAPSGGAERVRIALAWLLAR